MRSSRQPSRQRTLLSAHCRQCLLCLVSRQHLCSTSASGQSSLLSRQCHNLGACSALTSSMRLRLLILKPMAKTQLSRMRTSGIRAAQKAAGCQQAGVRTSKIGQKSPQQSTLQKLTVLQSLFCGVQQRRWVQLGSVWPSSGQLARLQLASCSTTPLTHRPSW